MFVVRKHEASNKTIRMPDELIARLEQIAHEKDLSFSALVVQCCEYALNNIQGENE